MPSVNYTSVAGKPPVPSSTTSFTSGSYTVPVGKVGVARVSLSTAMACRVYGGNGNIDSVANAPVANATSQIFTIYSGQSLSFSFSDPTANSTAGTSLTVTPVATASFTIGGSTVLTCTVRAQATSSSTTTTAIATQASVTGACYVELYDQ